MRWSPFPLALPIIESPGVQSGRHSSEKVLCRIIIINIIIPIFIVIFIIIIPSTQAGFSADGAGGSGLLAEGTWALSRALTQRTSQKIVFSIHQGSGGWGPSLLAKDLVFDPFLIDHFLLLTSK